MSQDVAVESPFCADPARDAAIRPVVERALDFLLERVGSGLLEAVILTGSLARGEGSVLLRPDGFRLLGDAEFLVIVRPAFDWTEARRRMVELSREATRRIGDDGRVASIEYAPAGLSYLRHAMRPCIFAHDLSRHGKVLWGRADILREVRPFGTDAIPPGDAVELIMNRIVELLMFDLAPRESAPDTLARAYHIVKTTLDLAGSALAFAGRFVSSYARRPAAFAELLAASPDLRSALPDPDVFREELQLASRCKLAPTIELLTPAAAGERVATVLAWAKGLWLWEMRRLLRRPDGSFPELLAGYVGHEPLGQRLRGWVKLCTHPLRPQRALAPLRAGRLLSRGSPRTLVYAAALVAQAGLTEGFADWESEATSLLPVPVRSGNGTVLQQVVDVWRWLIRNN